LCFLYLFGFISKLHSLLFLAYFFNVVITPLVIVLSIHLLIDFPAVFVCSYSSAFFLIQCHLRHVLSQVITLLDQLSYSCILCLKFDENPKARMRMEVDLDPQMLKNQYRSHFVTYHFEHDDLKRLVTMDVQSINCNLAVIND